MIRHRIRVRFEKSGTLRYIGHRDLMRLLERLFRRAGVVPAMSEGFHPKPRVSFPLALAVGIEGRAELFELEIRGFLADLSCVPLPDHAITPENFGPATDVILATAVHSVAEEFLRRMGREPVQGLIFHEITDLAEAEKKASVTAATYEIAVPTDELPQLHERLSAILAADTFPMERENRTPVDLRRSLRSAECVPDSAGGMGEIAGSSETGSMKAATVTLRMNFAVTTGADAGPRELLTALGLGDLEHHGTVLIRTGVH